MMKQTLSNSVGLLAFIFSTHVFSKPLNEVDWKDAKLAACVLEHAKKNGLTNTQEFTELKCHNKDINDGQDLSLFANLRDLSLFRNNLETLDLTRLSELENLNLANNQLQSIKLSGLSKLKTLFLFRNQLTSVDVSGLVSLEQFRIMQNKLTHIDILPLTALEKAYLFDNQLEDLPIDGLNSLSFLDVRQNPMPDELYDFYDEQVGINISHDGNADDWK